MCASARRATSTIAVSMTSWLVAPVCTCRAAATSNRATFSRSAPTRGIARLPACWPARASLRDVVDLGLAAAGDGAGCGRGDHAGGSLGLRQARLEVEHGLHDGGVVMDIGDVR